MGKSREHSHVFAFFVINACTVGLCECRSPTNSREWQWRCREGPKQVSAGLQTRLPRDSGVCLDVFRRAMEMERTREAAPSGKTARQVSLHFKELSPTTNDDLEVTSRCQHNVGLARPASRDCHLLWGELLSDPQGPRWEGLASICKIMGWPILAGAPAWTTI